MDIAINGRSIQMSKLMLKIEHNNIITLSIFFDLFIKKKSRLKNRARIMKSLWKKVEVKRGMSWLSRLSVSKNSVKSILRCASLRLAAIRNKRKFVKAFATINLVKKSHLVIQYKYSIKNMLYTYNTISLWIADFNAIIVISGIINSTKTEYRRLATVAAVS